MRKEGTMFRKAGCLLALILWGGTVPGTLAQTVEEKIRREPLQGLGGVGVMVEEVKPDAEQDGLTRSQLRADIERQLRTAGVRVFTREEAMATPGMPYLYVNVDTAKSDSGLYAYAVRVSLRQGVVLDRNPDTKMHTETWYVGDVGTVEATDLQKVSTAVAERVDEFINTYFAANPKAAQVPERVGEPESSEAEEGLPSPAPSQATAQESSEAREDVKPEDRSQETNRSKRLLEPRARNAPRR